MLQEHHIDCPQFQTPKLACLCGWIDEFKIELKQDDIVTRLRNETMYCSQAVCEPCATTREAADEIERLRAELEWARKHYPSCVKNYGCDPRCEAYRD